MSSLYQKDDNNDWCFCSPQTEQQTASVSKVLDKGQGH